MHFLPNNDITKGSSLQLARCCLLPLSPVVLLCSPEVLSVCPPAFFQNMILLSHQILSSVCYDPKTNKCVYFDEEKHQYLKFKIKVLIFV